MMCECRGELETDSETGEEAKGPALVAEAVDEEAFREGCTGKKLGLCVMALLDPAADGFEAHLADLQSVAGKIVSMA